MICTRGANTLGISAVTCVLEQSWSVEPLSPSRSNSRLLVQENRPEVRNRANSPRGDSGNARAKEGNSHYAEIRVGDFPGNFPSNLSKGAANESAKRFVADHRINEVGLTTMPPEQKVGGSNPLGRTTFQSTYRFLSKQPVHKDSVRAFWGTLLCLTVPLHIAPLRPLAWPGSWPS
jgi:hypothetical protein